MDPLALQTTLQAALDTTPPLLPPPFAAKQDSSLGLFLVDNGSHHEMQLGTGSAPITLRQNSLGCDTELVQQQGKNSWSSSIFASTSDHAAVQDQGTAHNMLSAPHLGTCFQHSAASPSLGHLQDGSQQLWLQTDNQQPAMLLIQQQPGDQQGRPSSNQLWGLPTQCLPVSSAQPQLGAAAPNQASLGSTCVLQEQGMVAVLQQHQHQHQQQGHISAPAVSDSLPVSHLQQASGVLGPMQQSQQVYLLPNGEQVVCVSSQGAPHRGAMHHQHLVTSCVAATSSSISSLGSAHAQLQHLPLQDVTQQQLTCVGTTAEQCWGLTGLHVPQAPVQQALSRASSFQGPTKAVVTSSPSAFQPQSPALDAPANGCPHKPGQLCTCSSMAGTSPGGSFSRQGSLSLSSSSWHGLDTLCSSNTSSPSFRMQQPGRRSAGPVLAAANCRSAPACDALRFPTHTDNNRLQTDAVSWGISGGAVSTNATGCGGSYAQGLAGPGAGVGVVVLSRPPAPGLASASVDGPYMVDGLGSGYAAGRVLHQPAAISMPPGHFVRGNSGGIAAAFTTQRHARFNGKPPGPSAQSRSGTMMAGGPSQRSLQARTGVAGAAAGTHVVCERPDEAASAASLASASTAAAPWAHVALEDGLKQLWCGEQLQRAKGGRLFNVQQLAWHPVGEPDPCPQDLYNFQKLKRVVQKLDAVHKTRVKLIKRIHAVADHGESDLKSVYREVRCLIGEMLHDSAMQIKSLDECRVAGLVRLALMLQCALEIGPKDAGA